ncbi:MAG TPA: bifunctional riboflavin kinase/FAD synthetase [Microbacteriaceae bacterium]|nr:bifunctional riboflavin kinase/FAD synthetase [Microbacteriaceae bacterium]
MRVYRGLESLPAGLPPSAVTIGKFDGVHRGHRSVIDAVVAAARRDGLTATAVTFDRNPLRLLAPEKCPADLTGPEQKVALLGETGLDATLVLTFDHGLAATSAEDFVADVLVGSLGMRRVLVGADFRFGARNAGSVETLRSLAPRHGYEVEVIDDVCRSGGRRISSSWIRELLAAGDVEAAAQLLGRLPAVTGEVVHGLERGRTLGFPTANLSADSEGMIPADGVYAGWLGLGGRRYPSAISVGDNPTFGDVPAKQVEAHVVDADLDLYGKRVRVEFAHRIRGMVAFAGPEALALRIRDDVDETRALLAR